MGGGTLSFFLQLFVILTVPYALWHFIRLRNIMPLVFIQILAGIMLGPSCLGRFLPEASSQLYNLSLANVSGISTIAVLFFGLVSGTHVEVSHYKKHGLAFAAVGMSSVFMPLVAGYLAGLWLFDHYPTQFGATIGRMEFSLVIGVTTSVTALPVLAAMLREMDLLHERIGQWALGLAAINDALLWIVMCALLAGHASTRDTNLAIPSVVALGGIYVVVMFAIVKPVLNRFIVAGRTDGPMSDGALVAICAITVASAAFTHAIGLHYILGAFIGGVVVPAAARKPLLNKIETVVVVLLMPFFFVTAGLRMKLDFASPEFLAVFLVTTAAAILGKVGGTAIAAKFVGQPWRFCWALGTLLQSKGLMEVVVLSILLDAGLINSNMFSALILMAIVTTALAAPLTRVFLNHSHKTWPDSAFVSVSTRT